MKIYLVGGAVRDQLLGRKITEKDWVVVGATPEEMITRGFTPVGKDFPVFLHPETSEEYALARTERKTGKGYKGFVFNADAAVTLEEDLIRRDLTINAIAQDDDGTLIDPFNGQSDIQAKILRHVSDAFIEDPVRILRIARFAARFDAFSIAPDTQQLMQQMVQNGEVNALVAERVWKECYRALDESAPWRFFETLEQCGALAIIFPELTSINSPALHNIVKLSNNGPTRFAALTYTLTQNQVRTLCKRIRIPNDYQSLAQLVAKQQSTLKNLNFNNAAGVVALLEQCDCYRRGDRLSGFVLAVAANEPSIDPHKTLALLEEALAMTFKINAQPFIEQGLQHQEIGRAIRSERIKILQKKSISD